MSFEILQSEVRALPAEARRKLMEFMVALQDESRESYAAKLAQKISTRFENKPSRPKFSKHLADKSGKLQSISRPNNF